MTTESRTTVGLLHPGDMGSAVGATVVAGGARVLWASAGRSAATRARAREAGLEDAGTLESVVQASRVIVSVVPPHGAADLARAVAQLGFRGVYVDAYAWAPAAAREIYARLADYKDTTQPPTVEEATAKLLGPANPSSGRLRVRLRNREG